MPQKYSVKYDIGGTMACEEDHIENAGVEESDSDASRNDEGQEQDSDVENEVNEEDNDTDNADDEGGKVMEQDQDQEVTDDSEGEGDDNTERVWMDAEITEIGETLWCGKEDDPGRQCWRRVDGLPVDVRTEEIKDSRLKNLRITDNTTELEIFWALMPLKEEDLLKIIRDGAEEARCGLVWDVHHVHAALCVIFGGAQFKDMTDLWSVKRKGMMPAPDFGLFL
jgi:Ni/Co efflux regulator RcnB